MSKQPHATASEQSASAHAARYEALRRHVMERQGAIAGYGLAVLLCQGVAAWMDVVPKAPAPARRSAQDNTGRPAPLFGGSNAEVVHVLAAMTMEHIQQAPL